METDLKMPQSSKRSIPVLCAIVILYIIACFICMSVLGSVSYVIFGLLFPQSESFLYHWVKESITVSVSLASVWLCAILFLKYIDQCPAGVLGMSIKGRWKECLTGILFAAILYIIGFTISILLSAIEIAEVKFDPEVLVGTFVFFFIAATEEEIMMRGYVQGRLMTRMNKFGALAVASLLFSLLHFPNPGIGLFPLFNLFLAGLLLGASYMYTRNLWFPIFLHTSWNWIQGPVLGYEVSGTSMFPSLVRQYLPEHNIMNGGNFGFEGSIICSVLMIIGTALIIVRFEKKKSKD